KYEKKSNVKALLVYGAPGTYLAALPTSLSGDILEKTGGKNIASDFPETKEYPQYAQLSVERIIEANPDVIYLITHGDPKSVKKAFEGEMMKNEAWKNLEAVKQNRVVILPPDLFGSNPGTKVTEAMDFMYKSIQDVRK
ncbi:ABC transporter substrate-binding protein, partial [Bacillus sp. HC-TM]